MQSIPFVDLHRQYLSIKEEIDSAIAGVIADSSFVRGKHVEQFEELFAELIGVDHCVSCANGTEALYIAMKALGLGPGDEVITTAHSWISTSETVTQTGARVVFCDTEKEYFTIDPEKIEALITPNTKGIIPVHLYGQPADMDPILEIAERHGLWVIEDCAQCHLSEYKGRRTGTMGVAATFSFYPGKNLGAMGDAGCLVTNDSNLAEQTALFARHGGKNNHQIEGINSRMDGLQAAILNVKIPRLSSWTAGRQSAAERYDELLREIPGVTLPSRRPESSHVFHLYVIQVDDRDGLRHHLGELGIASVINYPRALPLYDAYSYLNHSAEDFPSAVSASQRILSIPIFPEITVDEQVTVAGAIRQFVVGN